MVGQKQNIVQWLNEGAIWKDGVLLFKQIFGKKHPFMTLIRKGGDKTKYEILKQALYNYAKKLPDAKIADSKIADDKNPKPKLREDYAFLSEPNCPPELLILAAHKITAYHNYVAGHKSLFDCKDRQEQFLAGKKTVENYIQNRAIIAEFEYYKKNKAVLGNHAVFKFYLKIKQLRKMSVVDLIKHKKRIEDNIWRIKSEIAKGDKKHLQVERERSLQEKESELAEVKLIIDDYS